MLLPRASAPPSPQREIAPVSGLGGAIGRQADPVAQSGNRLKGDLARLGGAEAENTAEGGLSVLSARARRTEKPPQGIRRDTQDVFQIP
ncbi:hypothetical protein [Amycolatopsis sp. NPDC051372]|uniref:hypothetical protein n=1 Tax=unclassified Amycolatopsis TaxID=2618356 RepID=UPI00342140F3